MAKARQQQFTYGSDVPTYQPTSKTTFVQHKVNAEESAYASAKENSQKVREAHIIIGTDGGIGQQVPIDKSDVLKTGQVSKKQGTPVKDNVKDLKSANYKANFRIEHQNDVPNRFVSLNKAAMADANKGKEKLTDAQLAEMAEFKKDVRSSHFNFGMDKVNYRTTANEALGPHEVTIDSVTKGNNNRQS